MAYHFDKRSVKHIITRFVAAWNKADAKLFAVLLEEEAIVVDEQGRHFSGRSKSAKMLAALSKEKELRVTSRQFKAFHPDIVMSEVGWELDDSSANGTFDLVATCGPDEWPIEWVRFLPRNEDE